MVRERNRGASKSMLKAEDIVHPAIRAAAIRFERETGRKLADELYDEGDEGMIAIFLIVSGYAPDEPPSGGGVIQSAA